MANSLRFLAWLPAACFIALAACSDNQASAPVSVDHPSGTAAASKPSPPTADAGRAQLEPVVAPLSITGLRWAESNLPRRVPETNRALPSLIDDPPGRALVASYVPRPDGLGFPGEAIEFYGVDGRWRRLSLADLDLPQEGWHGLDTYGAGALSPNGRWWAGKMESGFFLVNLRDGSQRLSAPIGRRYGQPGSASFTWSPDSDELVVQVRGRSTRVTVRDLNREAFPRAKANPRLLANGGWVECPIVSRVERVCTTYSREGSPVVSREVPTDFQRRGGGLRDEVGEDAWFTLRSNKHRNPSPKEIVLTDPAFQARARLVLPRRSQINGVQWALGPSVLGLAAMNDRTLLAYLADTGEIVRLLRPGNLIPNTQDFWDISFARDLVRVE